jgi:hypothetical protein
LLLEGSPEQRLTELLVLPVYEALLASTGEETIDWKSFRTRADDYSHGPECGSNMRIPASAHRNTDAADAKEKDIRALRARTPGLDRWNWDERKEFLYVSLCSPHPEPCLCGSGEALSNEPEGFKER